MRYIIFALIIGILIIPSIHALQSEEYLNHMTNIIYEACQGQDINLKENWFIRADNKGFVTELKWPQYDLETIRALVNYISSSEPYSVSNNMFNTGDVTLDNKTYKLNNKGENILSCSNNQLDVYNREYYWNTRKIELPRNVEVTDGAKATFGDNSPITDGSSSVTYGDESPSVSGNDNTITQEKDSILIQLFWSKGTIGGTILGIILSFLLKVGYDKYKKKNRKSKGPRK